MAANWLAYSSPVVKNTEQEIVKTLQINKDTIDVVEKDSETKKVYNYIAHMWQKTRDEALYKTMKTINQKYGNSRATFTMPKVAIQNDRSGYYKFSKKLVCLKRDAPELVLVERLDEECHGVQKQNGVISLFRKAKDGITFLKNEMDYDELYDIPGTIEYEAHTLIQPQLVKEFLETYIENIDTTNSKNIERAIYIMDIVCQAYGCEMPTDLPASSKKSLLWQKREESQLRNPDKVEIEIWKNKKPKTQEK